MSSINNVSSNGSLSGANRVERSRTAPVQVPQQTSGATSADRPDAVEFSSTARRLNALNRNENTVRPEFVEQVRNQINRGNYDTDAKLDAALDALIDTLES